MLKRRGFLAVLGLLPAVPLLIKEALAAPPEVIAAPARVDAFTETFWPTTVISADKVGLPNCCYPTEHGMDYVHVDYYGTPVCEHEHCNIHSLTKQQVSMGMLRPFPGTPAPPR